MSDKKQELHKQLDLKADELQRNFYSDMLTTTGVKLKTLQGNTARAMRRGKFYNSYKPSSIFRNWVHNEFFESKKFYKMLLDEQDFNKIHNRTLKSLKSHWFSVEPEVEKGKYSYFFYKMIDLLFKSICRWKELDLDRRNWFFSNVNVPLDKYSLKCLSKYHDNYPIKNPSMGFIEDEGKYEEVQKAIKELVNPHTPLLFDLFAWDYERVIENEKLASFDLVKAKKQ